MVSRCLFKADRRRPVRPRTYERVETTLTRFCKTDTSRCTADGNALGVHRRVRHYACDRNPTGWSPRHFSHVNRPPLRPSASPPRAWQSYDVMRFLPGGQAAQETTKRAEGSHHGRVGQSQRRGDDAKMRDAWQRNVQRLQRCDFASGWQTHGGKAETARRGTEVSAGVAEDGK